MISRLSRSASGIPGERRSIDATPSTLANTLLKSCAIPPATAPHPASAIAAGPLPPARAPKHPPPPQRRPRPGPRAPRAHPAPRPHRNREPRRDRRLRRNRAQQLRPLRVALNQVRNVPPDAVEARPLVPPVAPSSDALRQVSIPIEGEEDQPARAPPGTGASRSPPAVPSPSGAVGSVREGVLKRTRRGSPPHRARTNPAPPPGTSNRPCAPHHHSTSSCVPVR